MIKTISRFLTLMVQRYLPDPLVFAIFLTIIVFVLGIAITPNGPLAMVKMWGDGFWNLLAFSMQMAMVLVTGHALASSPLLRRGMRNLAGVAATPAQGVMLVAFMSAVCSAINWGFGLVVGALFAREVARRVAGSDYRLLIASAYIGFITWHGGMSGSVPLVAATKGNPMEATIGLIPISQTIFTPYNIFITLALIVVVPFLCKSMLPKPEDVVAVDPSLLAEEPPTSKVLGPNASWAERVEESTFLAILVGALGCVYLVMYFVKNGFNINVNTVNLIFFTAGILLHKTPMSYMRAVVNAARGTAGILVQFPLYAAIQVMMEHSGLGGIITNWFVNISTKDTFAVLTFFSSGLVNLAVPSGGGHWVVQGPFVMPAAQALGADLGKAAMAIAYGEEWMNMAQPFWALPALAIAGLGVRDIMGYCVTALIWTLPIFLIGLHFL
ncbi:MULTISPECIES: TIGR00366 family protein [Sporomusa]|jgi:short-chain fatty acids transporter|uniref:Short-chain fatty acids transporter n=2 Tax=Sporomusa TaxID=2375 RepID=A0ABM9W4Z8_9FIRM|nr:TIGR00366 family protein [Sporomusa sphaeroides]MCM0759100.1 TIGR00366 family protein [Sporomusa sphaeroides DSM 2875]OLS56029.1 short-chain fatty acids transporter [Sporomusa sphaeroides DSM 2875]CVK20240.1 Short-chain fatty acids transporter [Sporomusa sphaeroides DSM 2875]SCM82729.1 short chain fatty acid transporter [uncultured Sporomusa sp.]HML33533.1 TIGR00366 family protein [Sporomusa sphaeroides]